MLLEQQRLCLIDSKANIMPYVDPEFTVPTIPQDEKYERTEVDENVRKGSSIPTLK